MYQVGALTNMFSDVMILIMPIPVVVGLHLSRAKRWAVVGILLTGSM